MVHRDIKPGNILLTEDGTVKVSDFGIARALASSTRSRTASLMGTPAYMSPEQWASGSLDGRLDQYALGILLYEMLSGATPFQGDSMEAIYVQHREAALPPLPSGLGAPSAVEAVIRRATEKNADSRFRSASDMATALERASGRTPPAGSGSVGVTPPSIPPQRPPRAGAGAGGGRVGGIPRWLMFGGLGAIVMAVISIVVAMSVSGGEGNGKTIQVVIPSDTSDTPEPTVNIDATVEAGIQQGLAERPTPAAKVVVATPAAGSSAAFVSQWGTKGTGDGQFDWPNGVAVTSDGSVYVADEENDRIQKFSVGP